LVFFSSFLLVNTVTSIEEELIIERHQRISSTQITKDSGELYARYRMDEGDRFSITFKHSVNQYPLTDTFEIANFFHTNHAD